MDLKKDNGPDRTLELDAGELNAVLKETSMRDEFPILYFYTQGDVLEITFLSNFGRFAGYNQLDDGSYSRPVINQLKFNRKAAGEWIEGILSISDGHCYAKSLDGFDGDPIILTRNMCALLIREFNGKSVSAELYKAYEEQIKMLLESYKFGLERNIGRSDEQIKLLEQYCKSIKVAQTQLAKERSLLKCTRAQISKDSVQLEADMKELARNTERVAKSEQQLTECVAVGRSKLEAFAMSIKKAVSTEHIDAAHFHGDVAIEDSEVGPIPPPPYRAV